MSGGGAGRGAGTVGLKIFEHIPSALNPYQVPQAYAAQLPVQVERQAATGSAAFAAASPQRSQQSLHQHTMGYKGDLLGECFCVK